MATAHIITHRNSSNATHGNPLFRGAILNYTFAIFAVAVAVVLTKLITSFIKSDPVEIFLGAVLLSTYFGGNAGVGPGILASILSIIALDYFFIPPINAFAFGVNDEIRITIFGMVALLKEASISISFPPEGMNSVTSKA